MFMPNILLLLLALNVCHILATQDYYKVLGVEKNASTADIKRAFKKLALKHHPDKSDDPKASEKFMTITTAYETLFNEEKRKAYDRMGHDAYEASKKAGRTPEEEEAFSSFFRQSTASSPDHESFFQGFDDFFSGKRGPNLRDGGMFFHTNGAPMFENDDFFEDIVFDPLWNADSGDHFGSGRSFFGGGHFQQHQQQHSQAKFQHHQHHARHHQQHRFFQDNDGFFTMFDDGFGHHSSDGRGFQHRAGATQKCVTTKYRNADGHMVESTSCTIG
ncbi:protein HLJ1 [Hyalella azteca]|uniref:DnaJ homolog subfamily B member 9 n=1 Tax=Hyalella azteca TaxID=294128 RepID=A0A8B7P463_HYAAZ|nr:protein HLJ1 [Hyalella azteca]